MGEEEETWPYRKPDPDEPWRYITPCCAAQPYSGDRTTKYTCHSCGESYDKDELVDLKYEGER